MRERNNNIQRSLAPTCGQVYVQSQQKNIRVTSR